jgi:hypothetical protein
LGRGLPSRTPNSSTFQVDLWDQWFTARAWKSVPRPAEFVPWDSMPLHTVSAPIVGAVVYLACLVLVPWVRKGRPPLEMPRVVRRVHQFPHTPGCEPRVSPLQTSCPVKQRDRSREDLGEGRAGWSGRRGLLAP